MRAWMNGSWKPWEWDEPQMIQSALMIGLVGGLLVLIVL